MLAIAGLNLSMVSLIGGFCKYYVDAKIGGLNSKIGGCPREGPNRLWGSAGQKAWL